MYINNVSVLCPSAWQTLVRIGHGAQQGHCPTVYEQTETSEDLQYSGTTPSVPTAEWMP